MEANVYDALSQQIIYKITQQELRLNQSGMKRSDIFDWYLGTQEEHINTEEDLAHYGKLIRSVVHRMNSRDCSLLIIQRYGFL